MSKTRESRDKSVSPDRGGNPRDGDPARQGFVSAPRLKPRRGLVVVLGFLLVLLLAGLLTLYFKTVYPHRNQPHAVEFDKPDVPVIAPK